jgi:hypothetical protein
VLDAARGDDEDPQATATSAMSAMDARKYMA